MKKLIFIYLCLLINKISAIGLPQTPQNFMRDHFTVPSHSTVRNILILIISPYFFEDEREKAVTVTGPRYVHVLENFLGPELAHHPVTE